MRGHCHRCRKPAAVCICLALPRVQNRTEVIILQHPKERLHPFGTARFAELGLTNVRTLVHHGLGRSASPLASIPPDTALIYPSERAFDLRDAPRPQALLFLDGTWAQARTLYRINPGLEALPHFYFQPRVASRYEIRSEPAPHCVSTIEAITEALAIVEPDLEGLDLLVKAFQSMIATQVDYRSVPNPRTKKPKPKPPSRAIPGALDRDRRIIVGHAEVSDDELVYWAAMDLSGASFEAWVKPRRAPDAWWLDRTGLDGRAIEHGIDRDELRVRWCEFAGEADVLACWNQSTFAIFDPITDHPRDRVLLKAAYCNSRSAAAGSIDEVLVREGLARVSTPFPGRAGRVLGAVLPIAKWLTER